ncbi:hypothetical protein [Nostoc sp. LPT]|nr:hypothetical protein [Nostoc sp. LPT]
MSTTSPPGSAVSTRREPPDARGLANATLSLLASPLGRRLELLHR